MSTSHAAQNESVTMAGVAAKAGDDNGEEGCSVGSGVGMADVRGVSIAERRAAKRDGKGRQPGKKIVDDGDGASRDDRVRRPGHYHLDEGVFSLGETISYVSVGRIERPQVYWHERPLGDDQMRAPVPVSEVHDRHWRPSLSPSNAFSFHTGGTLANRPPLHLDHSHHFASLPPAPAPKYEPFRRGRGCVQREGASGSRDGSASVLAASMQRLNVVKRVQEPGGWRERKQEQAGWQQGQGHWSGERDRSGWAGEGSRHRSGSSTERGRRPWRDGGEEEGKRGIMNRVRQG